MTELVITIGVPFWTIPAALLAGLYAPKLARLLAWLVHSALYTERPPGQ